MPSKSKYEQMLEHLINEDQEAARDLFHQLVVEKSREIYENILSEDLYEAETDEEDLEDDEGFDDEMPEDGMEDEMDIGGDATDDLEDEMQDPDAGESSDEDLGRLEDEIDDLADQLEDIRAEFAELMGNTDEEDFGDELDSEEGEEDFGDELDSEEGEEDFGDELDSEEGEDDSAWKNESVIREEAKLTPVPKAKMGDDGVNNKSIVPGGKKGGVNNIAKGGEAAGKSTGTQAPKAPKPKVDDGGNINKPGNSKLKQRPVPKAKMGDDGVNNKSIAKPAKGLR